MSTQDAPPDLTVLANDYGSVDLKDSQGNEYRLTEREPGVVTIYVQRPADHRTHYGLILLESVSGNAVAIRLKPCPGRELEPPVRPLRASPTAPHAAQGAPR